MTLALRSFCLCVAGREKSVIFGAKKRGFCTRAFEKGPRVCTRESKFWRMYICKAEYNE
jgi:hypothetical protein